MTTDPVALTALILNLAALLVLFGLRSWLQHRTTGSTGFHGVSGRPGSLEWIGGMLFVVALLLGLEGCALAASGSLPSVAPPPIAVAGAILAGGGFILTAAAQSGMGASWRIGVDENDSTDLVMTGIFQFARNPIFSFMVLGQAGLCLMALNAATLCATVALVAAVQLQVRFVEEPYLLREHGDRYRDYTARVGRFLPSPSWLAASLSRATRSG